MALTVTTDLTNITTAESTSDWALIGTGGGLALEPDYFVQGSNCISVPVSGSNKKKGAIYDLGTGLGGTLDFSATGTEENMLIYIWIRCSTPGLIKTIANAGAGIRVSDGTNYSEFSIGGSDFGFPDTRGFICFVIDPTVTPTATSGTLNLAAVSGIGAFIETTATAKGQNLGIDRISYGRGVIRGTGTATTGEGFKDLADWDFSANTTQRWGLMDVREGVIYCRCKIVIGDDTGTLATTFTSNDETLIWETPMYYDGTNRVKAVPDADEDGANYWGLEFVGNATGATNVTIGTLVGTDAGRSGSTFSVAENADLTTPARQEWRLVGDDGNVDSVDLYACTFRNCERASPDNAFDFNGLVAADEVFSCTFDACGRIDFGACEVRNCTILNSITDTDDGAVIWDADTDLEDCSFLNNTHSVVFEATTGTPFTFTNITFNPTALAVRNESGGAITINISGGSTPTAEDSGVGSATTITNTVTLTVNVKDTDGANIQGAQVYVQKQTPTDYTSGAGNAAGDPDLVVTQTIDSDTPQTGWLNVLDVSENGVQAFRYASHDAANTFTLRAEVTGTCTAGGNATTLKDSVVDLTTLDIEKGDTIRNTTDTEWALVVSIDDADTITTTPLSGGASWDTSDGYSVHRLATALTSGTDQIDVPIINQRTNASGNVTKSFPYAADRDVIIRVRDVDGATSYISPVPPPTATINSAGMSASVILTEDTVYQ